MSQKGAEKTDLTIKTRRGNLVSSGRKDTSQTTEREEDCLNCDGW